MQKTLTEWFDSLDLDQKLNIYCFIHQVNSDLLTCKFDLDDLFKPTDTVGGTE